MKKIILSENGLPRHIHIRENNFLRDDYAFIEAIPGVVFAVVISYVYLNVGTYMNGTLGSELVEMFDDNVAAWNSTSYWHNGTARNAGWGNTSSRNETNFPVTLASFNQSTTLFRITANDTGVGNGTLLFHLYANNVWITNRTITGGGNQAYNATLATISSNITTTVDYLNWTWWVNNSNNQIYIIYDDWIAPDWRDTIENRSVDTMQNISGNYDDNVNIIKVAITISVLLVPVMTIMTLRRFT